ncbi:MAG: hypothetical protein J7507_07460 [Pseudoxanthomonas sp.]|nr:hypothetical protein [Pseudoxanthomonas sp.]
MWRMTVLSTVLFASTAIAGAQAAGPTSGTPGTPPAASQAPVAGDPSSSCAYLTVNQGEIPETRDIFDAVITQIDGKSTPMSRTNRYRVEAGVHVLTLADRIDPKRVPAAANTQISKMKRLEQQRAYKKVELDVQPGVTYALGAKLLRDRLDVDSIRDNAYWQPVVWDMRPEPCK